jgi:DNA polymerase
MKLEKLNEEIRECQNCELEKTRTQVVPGSGNVNSDIMFIGEGPGKNEDLQGEPFVGAAGKFLNELLGEIGLKREDIYIANVVKCRPPNNRDPKPEEVQACWPWLEKQIEIIKPKLIITLGRHSLNRFIPEVSIGEYRGRVLRREIKGLGKIVLLPCYHPAAALYNGSLRKALRDDFIKIPKVLKLISKKR